MIQKVTAGILILLLVIAIRFLILSRAQGTTESSNQAMPPALTAQTESRATGPVATNPASPAKANNAEEKPVIQDQSKITTLREILKSKNDNDPRLDHDFNSLSENAKHLMRQEYKSFRPESFNEKGTIVFLLGRNLTTPQDFEFLAQVLTEPPCQNIEDCSKPAPPPSHEFADEEAVNDVTTSYPQIVSLHNLENFLGREDVSPTLKDLALRDLKLAEESKNQRISKMAQNIEGRVSRPSSGF